MRGRGYRACKGGRDVRAPRQACYWLCLLLLSLCVQGARADAYYDQGVRLFNQRNYKAAAPYFETALQNSPWDSNAYYYAALTYHYLGDWRRAKEAYRQVLGRFPGSEAATLAAAALKRIDPNFRPAAGQATSSSAGGSAGSQGERVSSSPNSSADYDSLPNEAKIYFTRERDSLMVDTEVNNRSMKMVFDTGASSCVLGKNHLQQLNITPPSGGPTGAVVGVGSSGVVPTWNLPVRLKVGNIVRDNFQVTVQDYLPTDPLLGQTFFRDFEYTIDNGANSISFRKKGQAGSSTRDNYTIPFTKEGNEIVVNVEVNGRPCPMYFDTGAEKISFGKEQLQRLGLSIPEDAREGTSTGIGGSTKSYSFAIQRMRLGPIDKSDVEVSVTEAANIGKPLLGQNFYKDWQYTIDNDHHLIKFVRR